MARLVFLLCSLWFVSVFSAERWVKDIVEQDKPVPPHACACPTPSTGRYQCAGDNTENCKNNRACTGSACFNRDAQVCFKGIDKNDDPKGSGDLICPKLNDKATRCGSVQTCQVWVEQGVRKYAQTTSPCFSSDAQVCFSKNGISPTTSSTLDGYLVCLKDNKRCAMACYDPTNNDCVKIDNNVAADGDAAETSLFCAKTGVKRCGYGCYSTAAEKCFSSATQTSTDAHVANGLLICNKDDKLCHPMGPRESYLATLQNGCTPPADSSFCFNPDTQICINGVTEDTNGGELAAGWVCPKNTKRCGASCINPDNQRCIGKEGQEQDTSKHNEFGYPIAKEKTQLCGNQEYNPDNLKCLDGSTEKTNVWFKTGLRLCDKGLATADITDCSCVPYACTTVTPTCPCVA